MRRRTLAFAVAVPLVTVGLVWLAQRVSPATPVVDRVTVLDASERSTTLAQARRSGEIAVLDAFITEQEARCAGGDPGEFRVLAEAHLERCLLRDRRRGMAVGRPVHAELPDAHRRDIEAGLRAADRAIEGGDSSADVHRIRSSLMSLRVTGLVSALAERPAIHEALRAAEAIDPRHPRVVVARACEKLFAPNALLGHDPAGAKRMFLLAAAALPLDERPLTFAAMCAFLLGESEEAVRLLEDAIARNPHNVYALEVLRRLRASEPEPFARDA